MRAARFLWSQIVKEFKPKNNKSENATKNRAVLAKTSFKAKPLSMKILFIRFIAIGNEKKVKNLGGLFIIGTERHESRRIDNQLRGRAGRQGDPGSSIFFISLQDELMRIFGGDSIDGILKKLGLKKNESIDLSLIHI